MTTARLVAPRLRPPAGSIDFDMTRHFLNALDELNKDVLQMGGLVESAVARAVRAFLDRDVREAQAVIDGDRDVNLQELRIDEECLKLLALYQPTARDLRF